MKQEPLLLSSPEPSLLCSIHTVTPALSVDPSFLPSVGSLLLCAQCPSPSAQTSQDQQLHFLPPPSQALTPFLCIRLHVCVCLFRVCVLLDVSTTNATHWHKQRCVLIRNWGFLQNSGRECGSASGTPKNRGLSSTGAISRLCASPLALPC